MRKSRSKQRKCAHRKMRRAQKGRLTFKHGQTTQRCAGSGELNWMEASLQKRAITAERSPDVSCAMKMAMHSLPGHRRMAKKELNKSTATDWAAGLCGTRTVKGDSEAQDARRRSFVCWCAANTSAGISSQRRRVSPAFSAHKLEVESLLSTQWSQGRR